MNKINVKTLNTQYSEITVIKNCNCHYILSDGKTRAYKYCPKCYGKSVSRHIVSNNGWLPLECWIYKFRKEE